MNHRVIRSAEAMDDGAMSEIMLNSESILNTSLLQESELDILSICFLYEMVLPQPHCHQLRRYRITI